MPQRDRFKAFAALIGGVVAISRSAIFVRWMQMPGVASAFYRVLFAAFVLWSFLALKPQQLPAWRRWDLLWALLGGICFAGDIGCYNVAVFEAGAGSATFLGSNAPIVVGLLTRFTTKRVPSAWFWTALAIDFTGAGMVVSIDWHPQSTSLHGDLIAVAASTCFALYLSYYRKASKPIWRAVSDDDFSKRERNGSGRIRLYHPCPIVCADRFRGSLIDGPGLGLPDWRIFQPYLRSRALAGHYVFGYFASRRTPYGLTCLLHLQGANENRSACRWSFDTCGCLGCK